jgi:hypothetical protein
VGAVFFNTGGRMDGQMDVTKLRNCFRRFANAHKRKIKSQVSKGNITIAMKLILQKVQKQMQYVIKIERELQL